MVVTAQGAPSLIGEAITGPEPRVASDPPRISSFSGPLSPSGRSSAREARSTAHQPSVVPIAEVDEHLVEAWRELARGAAEPNPFFEPGFVLAAARHLGASDVHLVLAWEEDRLRGCLPVRRDRLWHRAGPPVTRSWAHPYCFLGTPLLDAAGPLLAMERLLDELTTWGGPGRPLALGLVGDDGPVAAALRLALHRRRRVAVVVNTFQRAALEPSQAAPGATGRLRRERDRLQRRLEALAGAPVVLADRSGDPDAVDAFLRLEGAGWKGAAGTAMACRAADAGFFREMCRDFAGRGRLQLRSLECGPRLLAMKCSLVSEDGVAFCFKSAYDERWANSSPGFQLEIHDVARQLSEGRGRTDSCTDPENAMINRLWPGRRPIADLVAVPSGPLGRGLSVSLRALRGAKRRRRQA